MNPEIVIPEGTYQVMWFFNHKNPKEGIRSQFFSSETEALNFTSKQIGDWLILKQVQYAKGVEHFSWEIIKLNYSKKNILNLKKIIHAI